MPRDIALQTRENRLRRMAYRQGLRLEKSRRRDRRALDYGGYMLIDHTNMVVLGGGTRATLEDVERYLTRSPAEVEADEARRRRDVEETRIGHEREQESLKKMREDLRRLSR